jgi:hypothetical protein
VHLEITGLAVLISKHKTMTRIARESSSVKRATKKKKKRQQPHTEGFSKGCIRLIAVLICSCSPLF